MVTYSVAHVMHSAQPALVYILPTMVSMGLLGAFARKEVLFLVGWDEDREIK